MNSQSTKPRHKISKRETGILRRLFQLNSAVYQKSSNDGKNKIQEENKNINLSNNNIPENNISLVKKPEKVEERILDFKLFHNKKLNPILKLGCRYIHKENQLSLLDKKKSVIKIQSIFRSYLFKKHFIIKVEEEIEKKGIEEIILIQSLIRQYLVGIKIRKLFLRDEIVDKREECADKVINFFKSMYIKNEITIKAIKESIIKTREKSAEKIQHVYKGYKYYSQFKKLRNEMKNNYFITYPFYAKTVELKVFFPGSSTAINIGMFNSPSKQFPFEYNEFLNMFVLSIPPETFLSGEYRCQFLIDGFISCDGRFPNVEFNDGNLYNIVRFDVEKKKIPDNYNDFGNSQEPPDNQSIDSKKSEELIENVKKVRESINPGVEFDLQGELLGKKSEERMDEMKNLSFSQFNIDY